MPTILDLMEYANDALAQAAFVVNAASVSQYPTQDTDHVKATSVWDVSLSPPWFATDPTKSLTGGFTGSWMSNAVSNQRFHIDLGSAKVITKIYYENFHYLGVYTDRGAENFTFWGSNTGAGTFDDLVYANDEGWTQLTTSQSTFDQHAAADAADPKYITVTNTTAYRYYAIKIADNYGDVNYIGLRRVELQTVQPLQDYSEAAIKQEGSYSLKGIALITGSLNKTLTRTVSPTINLTDKTIIKFDIRASRTGSNIKIGIHDSGGTTTEITPVIAAADTWQTVVWNISAVANANKDAIDSIVITVVNADAANTFYIDNMFADIASGYLVYPLDLMEYANDAAARAAFVTDGDIDTYTKLLMHGDGIGQTILDEKGNTVNVYGNTTQSATQSKFGGKSIYFDGTGDYLSVNDSDDWDFGSGNFTVDWWEYRTASGGNILSRTTTSGYPAIWSFGADGAGTLLCLVTVSGSTWELNQSIGSTIFNAWTHYAVVRSGNVWYFFQNGVLISQVTAALTIPDSASALGIGTYSAFTGYIDEIRISKGIARWTADFSASLPTTPYSSSLQDYSESTIKQEGSYSLKGIALITTSLNNTLTRTVSPTINLTDKTIIKFDIRASRTGANIKIGIHDSGGTTTEITPTIVTADTWQTVTWDISAVANANKDVIDSIIVTIVNADAVNTFYIDNMFADTSYIKTILGLARENIKTVCGVPIASIKSIAGIA